MPGTKTTLATGRVSYSQGGMAVLFVFGCELAGIIGSLFTISAIPTWYSGLVKPPLNPPSWVFGPVWTTLYALMGIAGFLIWKKGWQKKEVKRALSLFGAQLILNALWSILFFGAQSPLYALIDILALWILLLITMMAFYRISKTAGLLLLPYIGWVSFATYLNAAIYFLN